MKAKIDYAVRIEASKLSLTDKFMQYEPKTNREQELKDLLTKVIKKGVKDFWRPRLDPSFNDDGSGIWFLGVLIKALVAENWTVEDAWDAVCNDSKKLGHYLNSENVKHEFEPIGSREICGFFELANTYKILAEDNDNFNSVGWLVLEEGSAEH